MQLGSEIFKVGEFGISQYNGVTFKLALRRTGVRFSGEPSVSERSRKGQPRIKTNAEIIPPGSGMAKAQVTHP